MRASLLDIVNRVYEIQLAKLELESLNCKNVTLNLDTTHFQFDAKDEIFMQLLQKTSWIKNVDEQETLINKVLNMHKCILRRWLDNYWLHYIYPFKAKTRPLIARSLINIILPSTYGTILDPFAGSGTVNVEAKWLGINTIGIDANPFYVYLSNAKCNFFDSINMEEIQNIAFLYSQTQRKDIRIPKYMERLNELEKSIELWKKMKGQISVGKHVIEQGDATNLNIDHESVDGIVTSPPYGTAIDYIAIDRGALQFFKVSHTLKTTYLSTKNLQQYFPMLSKSYEEMNRVLTPKGKVAIIIGNQTRNGQTVDIVGWTKNKFIDMGFNLKSEMTELLSSTNVYNILSDKILIFQRKE